MKKIHGDQTKMMMNVQVCLPSLSKAREARASCTRSVCKLHEKRESRESARSMRNGSRATAYNERKQKRESRRWGNNTRLKKWLIISSISLVGATCSASNHVTATFVSLVISPVAMVSLVHWKGSCLYCLIETLWSLWKFCVIPFQNFNIHRRFQTIHCFPVTKCIRFTSKITRKYGTVILNVMTTWIY